ncbi:hypothetical protein SKAU_G00311870 [Synaphobranchus kaupii]|uniref:Uncharacterized protein n=1 Tax=Synaphobranchus kaupii TaxID=118154 RepID=A0A9Q1IL48_SYNKA|nr:hypothetical protein SKAU_G00311870 [Synaphobranchus kaupii]
MNFKVAPGARSGSFTRLRLGALANRPEPLAPRRDSDKRESPRNDAVPPYKKRRLSAHHPALCPLATMRGVYRSSWYPLSWYCAYTADSYPGAKTAAFGRPCLVVLGTVED